MVDLVRAFGGVVSATLACFNCMATKRITQPDSTVYRGPARKRRLIFGSPSNFTPVPISRFAARIQPETGITARLAPDTATAFKRFGGKSF